MLFPTSLYLFFFFNDTATTEIYTLSLHDALPICSEVDHIEEPYVKARIVAPAEYIGAIMKLGQERRGRSEEHTSELQSQSNLVCRLLLEKKKKQFSAIRSDHVIRRHRSHVNISAL